MKHPVLCECEECFRNAVLAAVDKAIEKKVKKNPGKVCPFCGTNPSKPAKYGSGFKDSCGHEVRKNGLVIGWRKSRSSSIQKCINPKETKQLVFIGGKWVKEKNEIYRTSS